MRNLLGKIILGVMMVVVLQGCVGGGEGSGEKVVLLTEDGKREFAVEVMRTVEERQKGLMHRDDLPEGKGMLFVFEQPQELSFWMKNVKFPIDIVFFNEEREMLNVAREVPGCLKDPCENYVSNGDAKYVLEIGSGKAEEIGLEVGDKIEFINIEE